MTLESRRGRILPPDLDDRTWQDLVDEMRALIPKYAPHWTDHNPSDLGITLIELFAWLGENIIFRLNQTPEKNYLAFLNLLGITRDPQTPARTYLTFTSGLAGASTVPAGTQAQTVDTTGGQPVVFETDHDLVVQPTTLAAALELPPRASGATLAGAYRNRSAELVGPPTAGHLIEIKAGQTVDILLGFTRAVTAPLALEIRLFQAARPDAPVTVAARYSRGTDQPAAWPALPIPLVDGTDGFRHDGALRATVPADWAAQRSTGPDPARAWTEVVPASPADGIADPLFWIGLQLTAPPVTVPAGADPPPPLTVGIDRLLFNAVSARTALTTRGPEVLGISTGQPFQVFPLRQRPLFRRSGLAAPYADLHVQVEAGTPPVWQDWTLVDDFQAGPGLVYRIDPVAGEIRFGNFDPQSGKGNGAVPPKGSRIQATRYRYVDRGAAGNVAPGRVVARGPPPPTPLPPRLPRVTNLGPGRDGTDEEPIQETMRRAPEELRIRYRAVTVDDYEFLAREAAGDLVIRTCLPPRLHDRVPGESPERPWEYGGLVRAPGTVILVIVPDRGLDVARPEPTQDQIRLVTAYLDERRDLTARLEVVAPRYLPVIVSVTIQVWQEALAAGADIGTIESDTRARIQTFLHPTRGGPQGTGWRVGEPVFTSDLFRALMPAEDIGFISTLQVKPGIPAYHFPPQGPGGTFRADVERPFPLSDFGASVRLADYELVCAEKPELQVVRVHQVQR